MKKYCLLSIFFYSYLCMGQRVLSNAELQQYTQPKVNNAPTNEWFKDRRNLYFWDEFYIISGNRVYGTPFLYYDWCEGIITTPNGTVFSGYKLKYNAYDQTVHFSNGKDSLEVNEEIQEFTLVNRYPDTMIISKFINANQFKKEKQPLYYELILDNEKGQLLKLNKKLVVAPGKGISSNEVRRIFDLEVSYFYYDKTKKELTQIKANGSNITSIIGSNDTMTAELKNYDFSLEDQLIAFFTKYFELKKVK